MADDVVYINTSEGLKRVMNNSKLFCTLLSKFKNDTHLSAIETSVAEGDAEKAQAAAHTLKGLAANLSLIELYKQIAEFESLLKTGNINTALLETVKNTHAQTLLEVDKVIAQYA